jgi:dTMP kinase
MAAPKKGLLITIEGIDGVGKTSQAASFSEFLRKKGLEVVELREPTNGFWGQKIKNLTKQGRTVSPKEECQWFLKDRLEDVKNNIRPALESGKIVVMDRYYYSNMAYQSALGLDMDKIRCANEKFAPRPDLVIILDASPKTGLDRIQNKRNEALNHFETLEYQKKVRKRFLSMKDYDNVIILNGSRNFEDVQEDIRNTACKFLKLK